MQITRITSTELKNRLGKYLREAMRRPIEITSFGEITHYLLSADEYQQLKNSAKTKTPTDQSANSGQQD